MSDRMEEILQRVHRALEASARSKRVCDYCHHEHENGSLKFIRPTMGGRALVCGSCLDAAIKRGATLGPWVPYVDDPSVQAAGVMLRDRLTYRMVQLVEEHREEYDDAGAAALLRDLAVLLGIMGPKGEE